MNDNPLKIKKNLFIVFFEALLLIPIGIFSRCVIIAPSVQATLASVPGYPVPGTPPFVSGPLLETPMPIEVQKLLYYKEQLKSSSLPYK